MNKLDSTCSKKKDMLIIDQIIKFTNIDTPPPLHQLWESISIPWDKEKDSKKGYSDYTDGSKILGEVGCGVVIYMDTTP